LCIYTKPPPLHQCPHRNTYTLTKTELLVVLFTGLLFFAGYILQQQTVQGLQAVIKPRIPKPIYNAAPISYPTVNPVARASRPIFKAHSPSDSHDVLYNRQKHAKKSVDWNKLAYAQLVKSHGEVCGAVMLFAELARQRSPARRTLLFPRTWTVDKTEERDPDLARTRRLLRTAARRYGVDLRPIGVAKEGLDESRSTSYSLASLWELQEYERVLFLQSPGLLVDPGPLDAMLAFLEMDREQPVAGIIDPDSDAYTVDASKTNNDAINRKLSTSLLLVNPSLQTFTHLKSFRAAHAQLDSALLSSTFSGDSALLTSTSSPYFSTSLFSTTKSLRLVPAGAPISPLPQSEDSEPESELVNAITFNATYYLTTTSYVYFTDPELPGPAYYVDPDVKEKCKPSNNEARWAWERVYEVYRGRRMDVCGLDLETPEDDAGRQVAMETGHRDDL
jgi:hypothetical protein